MVLETEAHAFARRAHHGEGRLRSSADAWNMALPRGRPYDQRHEDGAAQGCTTAQPQDIDYINAHGTGTQFNDATETLAIKQTLQEHAYKTRISSTKSMTGHMLGAAGAFEAVVCIKVIGEGVIPPTINLDDPDPDCDLNYTPLTAQKAQVRVALSNSFGFGGHNACIMLLAGWGVSDAKEEIIWPRMSVQS